MIAMLAVLILSAAASRSYSEEVLRNYDVDIRIQEDRTLEVTENITAQVENVRIKRGIVRSFPVIYRDENGKEFTVGLDILDVRFDGGTIKWQVSNNGQYKDIRIGDPDRIITPGLHRFTIIYKTSNQLGFFENHDELYWNVTGNQWDFPIMSVSCRVSLPGKGFGDGFNSIEWYVGRYGDKGLSGRAKLESGGKVATTRSLEPGEGLTVVYTWPKGIIAPPPPPKQENERAQTGVAAATLIAVSAWFAFAWRKWGKDPEKKTVIPLFYPPKDASPAYLRYVRDLRVDTVAFTAAILGLAVKGALTVEEEAGVSGLFGKSKGKYILHRTAAAVSALEPEEDALMMHLFPGSVDTMELDDTNALRLSDSLQSLKRNMQKQSRKLFSSNVIKCLPGVLIYFAGIAALYPFSGQYFINLTIAGALGMFMIAFGFRGSKRAANTGLQNIVQFIKRIAAPAVAGIVGSVILTSRGFSPIILILFMSSTAVISAMKPLMAARTQAGSDVLSEIEGLVLYMNTAEKGRLEMFNPPEETPALFEKLLPYALALDVAETWGNRFARILSAAQYAPTWYMGPNPYIFLNTGGFRNFSTALGSQVAGIGAAQSINSFAPGSTSGFGGGGFSGGGGGGGGGSGW